MLLAVMLALIASAWTSPVFAARSGGTLNFMAHYSGDLSSLDPAKTSRYQDYLVSMNIHRSLYLYLWDPKTSLYPYSQALMSAIPERYPKARNIMLDKK